MSIKYISTDVNGFEDGTVDWFRVDGQTFGLVRADEYNEPRLLDEDGHQTHSHPEILSRISDVAQ